MRRTIVISAGVTIVVALLFGSLLSVSYYRRWEASKLLGVVRQIHPGTTSEIQSRALLKPFAKFEFEFEFDPQARDSVEYWFLNSPDWDPLRFALPWTLFKVRVEFVNGMVALVNVTEMQEDHPGYPHPNSASVRISSNRIRPPSAVFDPPADFNGYRESSRHTSGVDSQDNRNGFECCHARFIWLDERATPDQLSRSLNFRLSCMTSFIRCKNDRQLLP